MVSRKQTLTIMIFAILVSFAFIPLFPIIKAATSGTFNVSLSVTNVAPTVSFVQGDGSGTPSEGTTTSVVVWFNASDDNGALNLDNTTASVLITRNGEPTVTANCVNQSYSGNVMVFRCSATFQYYYIDGSWTINASIQDASAEYAQNISQSFTFGTLAAMQLMDNQLSFTGNIGDSDVAANDNPLKVNNTGNQDFTTMNLTAHDLVGQTNGAYTIATGNFSVNVTDAWGQRLNSNATVTQLLNATAPRGASGYEELYFRMNIPTGITGQDYFSDDEWVIDVGPS